MLVAGSTLRRGTMMTMSTTCPAPLGAIDHVVVLMLENRSFDNLLGHLYGVEGEGSNTLRHEGTDTVIRSWSTDATSFPAMTVPSPDPGEAFVDMNQQIFGLLERPTTNAEPDGPGELGPMGGFAQNYQVLVDGGETGDSGKARDTPVRDIMNAFSAAQTPVSTALAQAFRVVDSYHASAPCQTMPNRTFAWLGTAQGWVNNSTGITGGGVPHGPYVGPSIFGQLRQAGHPWRVYYGDFPLSLALTDTWASFDTDHFRPLAGFFDDAEAGDLPALTWIEPAYQLQPNDNHPPHDVGEGEALLARVYNALRCSSSWGRTLLVVTYDEHGGCYDRVRPGPAPEPGPPYPDGFRFDRYGVRVPCLLCSDFTLDSGNGGTTGPTVFDHTSLLALLRDRFALTGHLSDRVDQATSLGVLLNPAPGSSPPPLPVPVVSTGAKALQEQAEVDAERLLQAWRDGTSVPTLMTELKNDVKGLIEQAAIDALSPYLAALLAAIQRHEPKDPPGSLERLALLALIKGIELLLKAGTREQPSGLGRLIHWYARFVADRPQTLEAAPSVAELHTLKADAPAVSGDLGDVAEVVRQAMALRRPVS